MIWAPIQAITVAVVIYMNTRTHKVNPLVIRQFSDALYCCAVFLQGYFTFMVGRDIVIMIMEFFSGDFLGFWKTLAFHMISVPFDSLGLMVLATSGYIALQKEEGKACQ